MSFILSQLSLAGVDRAGGADAANVAAGAGCANELDIHLLYQPILLEYMTFNGVACRVFDWSRMVSVNSLVF